eukprot:3233962-Heterocapsa_arctica.AAC.1
MQCIEPRQATTADEVTPTQNSVLRRLGRALGDALPQPLEQDLHSDGALCALLKVRDMRFGKWHADALRTGASA